jgi:hypothetical protein
MLVTTETASEPCFSSDSRQTASFATRQVEKRTHLRTLRRCGDGGVAETKLAALTKTAKTAIRGAALSGRGGFVGDAESEVFDVVDGFVEEHRDVVVVERVDHAASVAGSGDQPHRAQ